MECNGCFRNHYYQSQEPFFEFHSITVDQLETTRIACTNDHATQNLQALYRYFEGSIIGPIKMTIFMQPDNLPEHEDGISLFKQITRFTAVSSVKLFNSSLGQILSFDPAEYNVNLSVMNTRLANLFVLATTGTRALKLKGSNILSMRTQGLSSSKTGPNGCAIKTMNLMQATSQTARSL